MYFVGIKNLLEAKVTDRHVEMHVEQKSLNPKSKNLKLI